jgi:hypothetical protein
MIKGFAKKIIPPGIARKVRAEFMKETHINRALRALNGNTYVEIGVAKGKCFRQIGASRKIAVDPAPKGFGHELAPGESLFEMTSDAFFAECAQGILAPGEVDVAFVDGLHEFPQALRDITNLEQFMSRRGVIFMHDCNPPTRIHSEARTGDSNGDVWKCAYYLTNYRPDLRFFTLNCDWGLGVLTGFGSSPGLESPSSDIVNACNSLDYSLLEQKRKHILRLHPFWYSRLFFGFIYPQRLKGW